LEILRGWGVSKAKIFKGKYEAKLEIPERWESSNHRIVMRWRERGVRIFSRTTNCYILDRKPQMM